MLKLKKDGFTLLEVIVSLAALSVISIFILRMFLASSNLNDRAKDTDMAINLAITEIESVKKHISLSDWQAETALNNMLENDGKITISQYYDNDWNISAQQGARYCLEMNLDPVNAPPIEEGASYGKLYMIQAEVSDMAFGEDGLSLASLQAKKYFPRSF